MRISKELSQLLKKVDKPTKVLDVGCGEGDFVGYLSSKFEQSAIYGLDINRKSLAKGIAKGNFQRAYAVHGDARKLTQRDFLFSLVDLEPKYYRHGYVDWEKLEEKELITLSNFELVTGINPYNRLSAKEVDLILTQGNITRNLVTVDIVGSPVAEGGFVIYQREIAHRMGGLYGCPTPDNLTREDINRNLEILRKEGKRGNLKVVTSVLIKDRYAINLAVLFNKTKLK
jgi:SAM-dependent methyltransferase